MSDQHAKPVEDGRMIVQLTAAEFRDIVRAEVANALQAAAQPAAAAEPSPWSDVAGAAARFNVRPETIRRWIHRGAPALVLGSKPHPLVRIDLKAFQAWLDGQSRRR